MRIAIHELSGFKNKLILRPTEMNSGQLDPCFAAFKRIYKIFSQSYFYDIFIANLQLMDKASIRVVFLEISKIVFNGMREFYKDKGVHLTVCFLQIFNFNKDNLSNEDIKFLNKISPKILIIDQIEWTVENIKALALLNCTKIDANFCNEKVPNSYLWFKHTPIQLYDFKSDQILTFEWDSIKFFIEKFQIENAKLFNTKTGFLLFIPLEIISGFMCLGFRKMFSAKDINRQSFDLGFEHQFNINGFAVPMRYLNRIFVELNDSELHYMKFREGIYQIVKEKHIELTIKNLSILLKINKLLPDDISCINFRYSDYRLTDSSKYSISEIIDNPNWINLKFWNVYKSYSLSPDEFQFWWAMLRSSKTRFSITWIYLIFSLLSECLAVLSLCSGCPELKSVDLRYIKADTENEHETVEQANSEFRQKFGLIQELRIWKVK